MYFKDGYVYGGEQKKPLRITSATLLHDRVFLLDFNNGDTRLFDMAQLDGPVFQPLQDQRTLAAFTLDHGVMTWFDGAIDVAPETMYEQGEVYVPASLSA